MRQASASRAEQGERGTSPSTPAVASQNARHYDGSDSRDPPGEQRVRMARYRMAVRLLATQGSWNPTPEGVGVI
jgi:hypothetical protein